MFGDGFFLYGAHAEDRLRGAPGEFLAQRDGAICRATVDGAVWITHLKAKARGKYAGIKLPAVQALGRRASRLPNSELPVDASVEHRTLREIHYVEQEAVGYLHFDFYNGAMSTGQCHRLRAALLFARRRPTRVIVLLGGRDFFSNGIHLNVIEARDSAMESWRNINAIDDLVREILTTSSQLMVAGVRGNAGAGGAMLAIAADFVFARTGAVINPHYRGMGGLHGSEYWTYTLPRRVGRARAIVLTEGCRPMGDGRPKQLDLSTTVSATASRHLSSPLPSAPENSLCARTFGDFAQKARAAVVGRKCQTSCPLSGRGAAAHVCQFLWQRSRLPSSSTAVRLQKRCCRN